MRAITDGTVVRTRNISRIAIASPGDFVCRWQALQAPPQTALPYCLDFLRARALYVAGIDAAAAQAAPFYYLHLRRAARRVISVPVEHGRIVSGPASAPVFLFSPGRCGSTLLSRVLHEAGIASVSEPDFYTQVASWLWSRRGNPLAGRFHRAMAAMSADLCAALGEGPVIKLRAECCRASHLLVAEPAARTIMLLRGFDDWSRSTARVFGAGPDKAVAKYLNALTCYAWLYQHSRCLLMRYEDWLSDSAAAARTLAGFLGRPIPPDAVARAASTHSQDGTPLFDRVRPGWEAKWRAAQALWCSPRLVTARKKLDLPPVWD